MWRIGCFSSVLLAATVMGQTAKDAAVYKMAVADFEARSVFLADDAVSGYTARLTRRIAPAETVDIRVIDDIFAKAHWFPGHVYVSTGVILQAHTEAELAGGIAHLLGHLAAPPMRFSDGYIFWLDECLRFPHLLPMQMRERAEEADREADAIGMRYLATSGYDPRGLVDFFGGSKFAVTEPVPDRDSDWIVDTSEFAAIQARLRPAAPRVPSLFH